MSVYSHARPGASGLRELTIALSLTVVMMVIELIAGLASGSLSLLADAGHMLADALALALSLGAAWLAARPASPEKTFGYYRTEILAALANGIGLWLIVFTIYAHALSRLRHPAQVDSGVMIVIAAVGLVFNLGCGRLLAKHRGTSLNIEGAWLNVMSDALGSLGVVVAGVLVRWRGWTLADPVASMLIGLLIGFSSWNLVRQSVNVLLEAAPQRVKIPDLTRTMETVPGVFQVHEVHLWTITTGMEAMSGHVIVNDVGKSTEVLAALNRVLSERFGITHTTLQLESKRPACELAHPGQAHAHTH